MHYINHDKVTAAFVKGARIIEDEGLTVIANRGVISNRLLRLAGLVSKRHANGPPIGALAGGIW